VEKIYLKDIDLLKKDAEQIPNTHLYSFIKVLMLVNLNMRYELIKENRNLEEHPYTLVQKLVNNARTFLAMWQEISFVEDNSHELEMLKKLQLEEKHQELFQKLWVNFSVDDYEDRIKRYEYRLDINDLGSGFIKGFKCIDFGCGHGNFAHALIRKGAARVLGLDYGEDNIDYANNMRDKLNISKDKIEFNFSSVYNTKQSKESYDFAIQNGVFHHLEDEEKAYKEVWRVLKNKGWFWVYTTGAGAIANDLWEASTHILKDIPHDFVINVLDNLNLKVGKRYHLGDGLNATYRRTTWKDITKFLTDIGFGNFRRLTGGYPTDFDHDVIQADKYGVEKFGEGDLRFLAQKI